MSRISRRGWLVASAGAVVFLTSAIAFPKSSKKSTHVVWKSVSVAGPTRQKQRERFLRSVLLKEGKQADWGIHDPPQIEASVTVVEFAVQRRDDVVRVTATAVGKLTNGPAVRTHFSFGDHPKRESKLEQMVLTLIARGVVTRLAAISRDRASRAAKKNASAHT